MVISANIDSLVYPSHSHILSVEKNPDLIILTDDVYGTFSENFRTVYSVLPYNTILVYSFSKLYGVTGWRTGLIAMNQNNVCDRLLGELPEEDREFLRNEYAIVTSEPDEMLFIDRVVADSRSIGLYHTSGLSTPSQVFMALMSLNLLDIDSLQGWFPTLPNSLRNRLMRHGTRSSLYIGLLNGLMPCGPLQAMQIYALSTGSWQTGAQSMLFFCLGTTPLMLGFGLVGGTLNRRFAKPVRIASGVLVLIMGMSMLINGLSLAGISLRPLTGNTADTAGHDSEVQIVQSELNWQGYPDITVRTDVPVRWVIHADEEKITGCNNEMVIPALDLRVPLSPGDNIVEFTVDEPGVIPYTCWMGMLNGSITAVEAE